MARRTERDDFRLHRILSLDGSVEPLEKSASFLTSTDKGDARTLASLATFMILCDGDIHSRQLLNEAPQICRSLGTNKSPVNGYVF
jgi:hypothetical protein